MPDSPKVKIYEIKSRIKNHELPKARVKDKTINFNFPKVSQITKLNCPELLTVTSTFLDFRTFAVSERERERELIPHKQVCSFLIFQISAVAPSTTATELSGGSIRLFCLPFFHQ